MATRTPTLEEACLALNPVTTKTRSGAPPWGVGQARTRLGRSLGHGELLPPSGCGHSCVEWGVTQLGQRDSQANDLAAWTERVKDFAAASLWQLPAWGDAVCSARRLLICFYFFRHWHSDLPPTGRQACCGGAGRRHPSALKTWENSFLDGGLAVWLDGSSGGMEQGLPTRNPSRYK